ncbi:MAG TPA: flagellar hook-length control protein FliK [Acidimicrobiales bacterium]|nr:flagellar hook-length control protein FliK [Acidimicrobiales bacterium]
MPTPAEQLTRAVLPLATGPDGTTRVSLSLHPADLGEVHVQVVLQASTVNVTIHAADPATRSLLAGQLGDLRNLLEGSGVATGALELGSGAGSGAGSGGRHPGWRPGSPGGGRSRAGGGAGIAAIAHPFPAAGDGPAPGPVPTTRILDLHL